MDTKKKIKNVFRMCSIILLMASVLPLLAYFIDFRPNGETAGSWFQRSGSIMVMLIILSEFRLFSIARYEIPVDKGTLQKQPVSEEFKKPYTLISYLSVLIAAIGTIIWGYGDLIV